MPRKIIGLEKLEEKLKELENPQGAMERGLRNYHAAIQRDIEKYPPATAANYPPPPFYVRGTGTFTGRKNNKKSEKLSNRWWKFRTRRLYKGVQGTITNSASYAPYVVGDRQARFHKLRGWPQTERVIEITKEQAVREIAKEIEKELRR